MRLAGANPAVLRAVSGFHDSPLRSPVLDRPKVEIARLLGISRRFL